MSDNAIKIEYEGESVYNGPLAPAKFQYVLDMLLSDAMKRDTRSRIGAADIQASVRDAAFGYYGWLLVTIAVTAGNKQPLFYVYILQGKKPVLEPFLSWVSAMPDFSTRWEFRIAYMDIREEDNMYLGQDLYRGQKLALTECADRVYRHALIQYAKEARSPEKAIGRNLRVKSCEGEHLSLEVSYNKISSSYVLSGPSAYIYELDCYFKGIYDDFEAMLKAGRVAAATVCGSIEDVCEAFGTDISQCLWFPFKMDGNLEGTYSKLESTGQILDKATRFCRLCVPDNGTPPNIRVEYVCHETDKVIMIKGRNKRLSFEYENRYGPSGPPTFALEVYAKAYADGEHITTYRYQVQDQLPVL